MASNRQKSVAEYMTTHSTGRIYTGLDVALIKNAIDKIRKQSHEKVKRTKSMFYFINMQTSLLLDSRYTPDEIKLCKRCIAMEYEDRTGHSSWGFKKYREKNGFDPVTGKAI